MSLENIAPQPTPEIRSQPERFTKEELARLGHLARLAIERDDLDAVVDAHIELTGKQNPNQHGKGFFVGEGDVPMSADNVYRQVHASAIEDLAETGVVRGQYTATNGEHAQTSSHATYWHDGKEGTNVSLGGRFVIEASKEAAETGWVKASDVRGIYARSVDDGQLHDITKL